MTKSDNQLGNPYHDELGRFTRAENDANRKETQSSGYAKNLQFEGKSWEELGKLGKRNEFIEVNFTTPVILKCFTKGLIATTEIQDIWEPVDFDQKWDKNGVDIIADLGDKQMYRIDLKCLTSKLGYDFDVANATHNIILFRYDPNKKTTEEEGWIFKNNSTDLVGFTAINTPYDMEQLFDLGEERTKFKKIRSASLFLVQKELLHNYIVDNFMSKEEYLKKFKNATFDLDYSGRTAKEIPIVGKDGITTKMVVSLDKVTGGYVAELKLSNGTLQKKCNGRGFIWK